MDDLILVESGVALVGASMAYVWVAQKLHCEGNRSNPSPASQTSLQRKDLCDGVLTHNSSLRTYSAIHNEPDGRFFSRLAPFEQSIHQAIIQSCNVEYVTKHPERENKIFITAECGKSIVKEKHPKAHEPCMEAVIGDQENSPLLDSRCFCNVEGNFHQMHYPLEHVLFSAVAG